MSDEFDLDGFDVTRRYALHHLVQAAGALYTLIGQLRGPNPQATMTGVHHDATTAAIGLVPRAEVDAAVDQATQALGLGAEWCSCETPRVHQATVERLIPEAERRADGPILSDAVQRALVASHSQTVERLAAVGLSDPWRSEKECATIAPTWPSGNRGLRDYAAVHLTLALNGLVGLLAPRPDATRPDDDPGLPVDRVHTVRAYAARALFSLFPPDEGEPAHARARGLADVTDTTEITPEIQTRLDWLTAMNLVTPEQQMRRPPFVLVPDLTTPIPYDGHAH